ncbi:MAG: acyl--CoA ligase [Rudanella sp.]|nr:acyl--CoA ligase [Rudanella sp.]
MTLNFYERIHRTLLENPDQESIIWPNTDQTDSVYTNRVILDRVATVRQVLSQQGIVSGQSVLLAVPVSFDLIGSLLAIMALGAIPVLPPAGSSLWGVLLLMRRHGSKAVIVAKRPPAFIQLIANWLDILILTPTTHSGASITWLPPQTVDPNQPALISHSSGSTGQPKAIWRSHRVLLAQHEALSRSFPAWPGQRDFPLFPNILLHNLATGTVSILPDLPRFALTRIDPARIVQQIIRQRVQTLTGNVYYFVNLLAYLQTHPHPFPQVRAVGVGGSPVPERLAQALKATFAGAEVYIIYGSSEAEPIAIRTVGSGPENPRLGYVVGLIHPSIQVRIRPTDTLRFADETTQPMGEIEVKGAHVATDTTDWLATGDYGYLNPAGQLVLTGRRGNAQLHGGVGHYQIEHTLLAVAGVEQAAARATETGFAVYVQGSTNEADLRRLLADQFPADLIEQIQFRDTLPVDARHHSKIRYDAL